ncbi:uncharacterized protein LOC144609525 isoform X2 [Rhinoraja longicauda]
MPMNTSASSPSGSRLSQPSLQGLPMNTSVASPSGSRSSQPLLQGLPMNTSAASQTGSRTSQPSLQDVMADRTRDSIHSGRTSLHSTNGLLPETVGVSEPPPAAVTDVDSASFRPGSLESLAEVEDSEHPVGETNDRRQPTGSAQHPLPFP